MKFVRVSLSALALALTLGAAGPSQATCTQTDLAGTWQFYAVGTSSFVYCTVTITSGGAVTSAGNCINKNGTIFTITSGKLTVAPSCSFSGTLTTLKKHAQRGAAVTIDRGTLTNDTVIASGIGHDHGGSFLFNIVKN